ncbi:MAG: ZIP family metal transporter [Patescibacteria group bacterium]
MIDIYIYSLSSVLVVSLISLIGAALISIRKSVLHHLIIVLVALAIGALVGDAFFHLIPEAVENGMGIHTIGLFVIAGMMTFFVLEKVLGHHHHHHHDESEYTSSAQVAFTETGGLPIATIKPVGRLVLIADSVHNYFDGVIIAASFLINIPTGIASTVAIIFHEIPQEIGDFGILLYAGYSRARALLFNLYSALFAMLGALTVLALGDAVQGVLIYIVPFSAGIFIYIASSDLVPELHKRPTILSSILQMIAIAIGVGAMYALMLLE